MSVMSELDMVVNALRESGEAIIAAAETLAKVLSGRTAEPPAETLQDTPETEKAAPEKTVTLEEVRAVLAEKSRSGHTAEVKALLEKHGASRLSDIDPAEYAALLAEAEVLK